MEYRTSCPLDCFDLCRFIVQADGDRIVSLKGDTAHPVTKGVICKKGKALAARHHHPDRLTHPLIRKKSGFVKTSWDAATDLICERISAIHERHGPTAILNFVSGGYGGLKGNIQNIFFNCLGGATTPEGSLCWGAGIAAQKYDFGSSKGHFPDDVENADLVLVWGRNPKVTNLHLFTRLKNAKKKGTRIIVIDPLRTQTAGSFDTHIRINPSTDGALALGMARIIMENGWTDTDYIKNHVKGFNRFKRSLDGYTVQQVSRITGIETADIEMLAAAFATAKKAMIYIGYGMQRYQNSGSTVRCVDALAAITGKIGRPGCGVNYASKGIARLMGDVEKQSRKHIKETRQFVVGRLGKFLESAKKPGIKAAFVAGANPLNQCPDLKSAVSGFSHIPFKVVFDHFMTDTARHADIVLPAATVFEQEDFFVTSMYSPVINYSQKVMEPRQGIVPEFEFYLNLAKRIGLSHLGFASSGEFLEKSTTTLQNELNISFDALKAPDAYIRLNNLDIAWDDKKFDTPSGKYELYSESAQKGGLKPLPVFKPPVQADKEFPLRLLTTHSIDSLHSQGFTFTDTYPDVHIHPATAAILGFVEGGVVRIVGRKAEIKARLRITDGVHEKTVLIYQGYWHKSGAVNFLTAPVISDMGEQAAYYDSFVRIEKTAGES